MPNADEILQRAIDHVWLVAPDGIDSDIDSFVERHRAGLEEMIEAFLLCVPIDRSSGRWFMVRDTYLDAVVELPGSTVLFRPADTAKFLGHRTVGDTFTWTTVGTLEVTVDHEGLNTGHDFYYAVDGGHQRLIFTSDAHEVT